MTNRFIDRIRVCDTQLAVIAKIKASGEYLAAGLTITMTVGPGQGDKDPATQVHFRDPTLVLVSHQVQSVKDQTHVGKESEFPTVLLETEPLPKQTGLDHER